MEYKLKDCIDCLVYIFIDILRHTKDIKQQAILSKRKNEIIQKLKEIENKLEKIYEEL